MRHPRTKKKKHDFPSGWNCHRSHQGGDDMGRGGGARVSRSAGSGETTMATSPVSSSAEKGDDVKGVQGKKGVSKLGRKQALGANAPSHQRMTMISSHLGQHVVGMILIESQGNGVTGSRRSTDGCPRGRDPPRRNRSQRWVYMTKILAFWLCRRRGQARSR